MKLHFRQGLVQMKLLLLWSFTPQNKLINSRRNYIVNTVFLQIALWYFAACVKVTPPVWRLTFNCRFSYFKMAVWLSICVIEDSFSPFIVVIFANSPGLVLLNTIVLMPPILWEQSYFSCLNLSGKQEHKVADSSNSVIALIRFSECVIFNIN